ncbi:hypothetical protein JCM19231_566 [Vibrio ishigakensis]|uniref:Uncharacterized protein n=1 Tax=Vibrio ishigakensis TaxID=1481914 RepID=A0A0B8P0G0_9VIBR|nr:hypothetical protein JCM19231_566 [Vibrio ishigakensis]
MSDFDLAGDQIQIQINKVSFARELHKAVIEVETPSVVVDGFPVKHGTHINIVHDELGVYIDT